MQFIKVNKIKNVFYVENRFLKQETWSNTLKEFMKDKCWHGSAVEIFEINIEIIYLVKNLGYIFCNENCQFHYVHKNTGTFSSIPCTLWHKQFMLTHTTNLITFLVPSSFEFFFPKMTSNSLMQAYPTASCQFHSMNIECQLN